MEKETFNRLTENGLFLTAREVVTLQNKGCVEVTIDLTHEPASYALTFGEWLNIPSGVVKITVATQKAFVYLKLKSVYFDYSQPFNSLSIPRKITVAALNKVVKS